MVKVPPAMAREWRVRGEGILYTVLRVCNVWYQGVRGDMMKAQSRELP